MNNEKILVVFARNIKLYREKRALSQEALAELAGLHRTYVSDIERCSRNISLKNLEKLAIALDLEPYMLLEDESA